MARQALIEAGLPFELVRSEDVRAGVLSRYRMLFVPGGWAIHKMRALGETGQMQIRRFVEKGGSYLGLCGGAGLATEKGIGLLPIGRKASKERVPSFSGPIRLSTDKHRMWQDIENPIFLAWWPSQLEMSGRNGVRILAKYGEAQADAFSADIKVADGRDIGWPRLESRYGILLDPARLQSEPAVVAGRFGKGQVILSMIHFDTPGDPNGRIVLRNLWNMMAPTLYSEGPKNLSLTESSLPRNDPQAMNAIIDEIQSAVLGLIDAGARDFLWSWRNPFLLQWRRGVRGLEYSTLAVMIGEIAKHLKAGKAGSDNQNPLFLPEDLRKMREMTMPFVEKAKRLIAKERFYMTMVSLSPLECPDEEISDLRRELFGGRMSHGGRFKDLIHSMDIMLYRLMKDISCP
jgi:hypothetical protein